MSSAELTFSTIDVLTLAELRRKDPDLALRIATLSASQNKEASNAGR